MAKTMRGVLEELFNEGIKTNNRGLKENYIDIALTQIKERLQELEKEWWDEEN